MEMPDSGQLDPERPSPRSRPPADLAGSSSSLAGLQGGKRLWLGRSLPSGSTEEEAAESHSPAHSGRTGDLG